MIAMVWLPQKQIANVFFSNVSFSNVPWLTHLKDWWVRFWAPLLGRAHLSGAETVTPSPEAFCYVGQSRSQGLWGSSDLRESNYWAESSAPAEMIWQMVSDLADIASWHPLITATNAPRGQRAKPGLIYRAFRRYFPLSMPVFVERVLPGELLSIRRFPFPGLQERVTYRIVSTTLCGTCVLYSMTLSGWLSPLAWPMMKPQATRVAAALVQAAEKAVSHDNGPLYRANPQADIF